MHGNENALLRLNPAGRNALQRWRNENVSQALFFDEEILVFAALH
jgi:hypothetical protein